MKHGDLQVWWIPQVPMHSFMVPVNSLREAELVLDTLAKYDTFQYENNIKPDYSNAGGLVIWDDNVEPDDDGTKWVDWYDENGNDFNEYIGIKYNYHI